MKYLSSIATKLKLLNASRIIQFTIILLLSSALSASAYGIGGHKAAEKNNPFIVITGKVTGDAGAPLSGVSVSVKGTNRGTTTNAQGNFSIDAAANATLIF